MDRTLSRLGPRLARLCLVAAALLTPTAPAAAQGACEFKLGFELLADRIPDAVGRCLEKEHHNPANGDALQRTTGGLLVWRKGDNWTAFTDGYRTWVDGPLGLQRRLNTDRFAWEGPPPPRPVGVRALFIARDGAAAVLTVQTAPGGACTLVQTPAGGAAPVDLGERTADASGYAAWSWTAGPRGGAGVATVACGEDSVTEPLDVGT
jgi:hypothetical protein